MMCSLLRYFLIMLLVYSIVEGQQYRIIIKEQALAQSSPDSLPKTYEELKEEKSQGKTITPSVEPVVAQGVDFYVALEYLLWQADEGGLQYIMTMVPAPTTPPVSNNNLEQGTVVGPSFNFRSGFKVGLGFDTDYDGWDFGVLYTWLYGKASNSFGVSDALDVPNNLTLWAGNFTVLPFNQRADIALFQNSAQTGNAQWILHFNSVDADLGRAFFVSPRLILRPHFGLKGAWIKQLYNIEYNQEGISGLITAPGGTQQAFVLAAEDYHIHNVQHAWGLGPRVGFDTTWMLLKDVSCFGNFSLAGLWGQFSTTRVDTSNVMNLITHKVVVENFTAVNAKSKFRQFMPVIETQIGFNYDYWLQDSRYRMRFQLVWETQTWLDQNQFLEAGVFGNLGLQGLTASFRVDF